MAHFRPRSDMTLLVITRLTLYYYAHRMVETKTITLYYLL